MAALSLDAEQRLLQEDSAGGEKSAIAACRRQAAATWRRRSARRMRLRSPVARRQDEASLEARVTPRASAPASAARRCCVETRPDWLIGPEGGRNFRQKRQRPPLATSLRDILLGPRVLRVQRQLHACRTACRYRFWRA